MKLLPSYKEMVTGDLAYPSVSVIDTKGSLTTQQAEMIYEYLMGATLVDEWLSGIPDPLDMDKRVPNRFWTDGIYHWSQMHAYLIKTYRPAVPSAFLDHVQQSVKDKGLPSKLELSSILPEIKQALIQVKLGDTSFYDLSWDADGSCNCKETVLVVEVTCSREQFIENFSLIDSDSAAWMELYQCQVCLQFWAIEKGAELDRRHNLAFKLTQSQNLKTFDFSSARDKWKAQKYGEISQNQCMYKGCDNFAVKGKVFCLKHLT